MNGIIRALLLLFLFSFSLRLWSQDVSAGLDKVYGLDPLLFNGKKYSYFLPAGTGGTQFLTIAEFGKGDIIIRGEKFSDVSLNYDIYNQQLLLQYSGESGSSEIIEVSKAWLEGFRLEGKDFRLFDFDDGPRFYQVLGDGPYFILYYWRKELKLDATAGTHKFYFSPPIQKRFVLINGVPYPFGSKASLLSHFDQGYKPGIKNYLKSKKIKLKKASDKEMTDLINFISKQLM